MFLFRFQTFNEEVEDRETYDDWADRIYKEFSRRRQQRQQQEQVQKQQPPKSPEKPQEWPPQLPKKLKLETPASQLRKRYLEFVRGVLDDPSVKISLKGLPFSKSTGQREVAEAIFGDFDEEEEEGRSKTAIRKALLTWHPDKFTQRFGPRFAPGQKDRICEVIVHVSQSLLAAGNIK